MQTDPEVFRLLDGRTAIVTGGAHGIGFETAKLLARMGASVVIADKDSARAESTALVLGGEGFAAASVPCDVTRPDEVDNLVATARDLFGGLDIYVNNAGVTRDAVMRKMSIDEFDLVLDVHVRGAWLGTRAAMRTMRELELPGSIINMSSISGKVGNPGQTNYSTAKAALIGLTKSSAKEGARYGIRVNAIQPGLIATEMTSAMPPDVLKERIRDVPLGRIGRPVEVANVIAFLASDMSSYVTGAVIEVTGGRHM